MILKICISLRTCTLQYFHLFNSTFRNPYFPDLVCLRLQSYVALHSFICNWIEFYEHDQSEKPAAGEGVVLVGGLFQAPLPTPNNPFSEGNNPKTHMETYVSGGEKEEKRRKGEKEPGGQSSNNTYAIKNANNNPLQHNIMTFITFITMTTTTNNACQPAKKKAGKRSSSWKN